MNIHIKTAAAVLALSLATVPAFADVLGSNRGVARSGYSNVVRPAAGGDLYARIVADQLTHSNDNESAAGGNAEQPERYVPQFGGR